MFSVERLAHGPEGPCCLFLSRPPLLARKRLSQFNLVRAHHLLVPVHTCNGSRSELWCRSSSALLKKRDASFGRARASQDQLATWLKHLGFSAPGTFSSAASPAFTHCGTHSSDATKCLTLHTPRRRAMPIADVASVRTLSEVLMPGSAAIDRKPMPCEMPLAKPPSSASPELNATVLWALDQCLVQWSPFIETPSTC